MWRAFYGQLFKAQDAQARGRMEREEMRLVVGERGGVWRTRTASLETNSTSPGRVGWGRTCARSAAVDVVLLLLLAAIFFCCRSRLWRSIYCLAPQRKKV